MGRWIRYLGRFWMLASLEQSSRQDNQHTQNYWQHINCETIQGQHQWLIEVRKKVEQKLSDTCCLVMELNSSYDHNVYSKESISISFRKCVTVSRRYHCYIAMYPIDDCLLLRHSVNWKVPLTIIYFDDQAALKTLVR